MHIQEDILTAGTRNKFSKKISTNHKINKKKSNYFNFKCFMISYFICITCEKIFFKYFMHSFANDNK